MACACRSRGDHRTVDKRLRRLADQHLARRRRLLEARRDVDRVPGHQPLRRPRHHLPGVHTDPAPKAELRKRIAHLHRRPTRPQRIILMRLRDPEDRHHRITNELIHPPTMRLHDPAHPHEITGQQRPQHFRINRLAKRSRTNHITEHHRHRLPHLTRRRSNNQRRSTRHAKARLTGVFNDQTDNLVLVNGDGTGLVRLVHTRAGDQYIGASFSPDGTRIAYSGVGRNGNADVYTIRPDGSDQREITFSQAVDTDPSWSADGTKIAFETNRNGNVDIYSVNADGSNSTQLTNSPLDEQDPSWSRTTRSPTPSSLARRAVRSG